MALYDTGQVQLAPSPGLSQTDLVMLVGLLEMLAPSIKVKTDEPSMKMLNVFYGDVPSGQLQTLMVNAIAVCTERVITHQYIRADIVKQLDLLPPSWGDAVPQMQYWSDVIRMYNAGQNPYKLEEGHWLHPAVRELTENYRGENWRSIPALQQDSTITAQVRGEYNTLRDAYIQRVLRIGGIATTMAVLRRDRAEFAARNKARKQLEEIAAEILARRRAEDPLDIFNHRLDRLLYPCRMAEEWRQSLVEAVAWTKYTDLVVPDEFHLTRYSWVNG